MLAIHGFDDLELARKLQEEYDKEAAAQLDSQSAAVELSRGTNQTVRSSVSPVDPSLEVSDPNPDIRELFLEFNQQFFWGGLSGIEVKWSPRMTLCAGLCVYEGRGGLCSVRLSQPLLKLRPRKDLVETLLHEMIHAYLFVTDNDRDHDGHGPNFHKHMYRINKATGANISVYHTFHDEVASYQQHWWKCDGPCKHRPPYYGMVKRAMNRPPSQRDPWFPQHQATCGGTFVKVKEPEGYGQKKSGKTVKGADKTADIRSFAGKGSVLGGTSSGFPAGSKRGVNDEHKKASSGGGLAMITNGVLTHRKAHTSSDTTSLSNGKTSSNLSTSVSLSAPSLKSSSNPVSGVKSKTHEQDEDSDIIYLKTSSPSARLPISGKDLNSHRKLDVGIKSKQATPKVLRGKGKTGFNDNITLLELFKRRQAKEKEKKSCTSSDSDSGCKKDGLCKKLAGLDVESTGNDSDDFVVDLTQTDEKDNSANHSSSVIKQEKKSPSKSNRLDRLMNDVHKTTPTKSEQHTAENKDNKTVAERDDCSPAVRPRWKNIFPGMSGKKHRDNNKGKERDRKGKSSKPFVSVCEGGSSKDVKSKGIGKKSKSGGGKHTKRKKSYVFDELDDNDGLWEESSAYGNITTVKKEDLQSNGNNTDIQSSLGQAEDESLNLEKQTSPHHSAGIPISSTSKTPNGGYILGGAEAGPSYLAQVRRTLNGESCNARQFKSSTEHEISKDLATAVSNKRSSGVAFGESKGNEGAKRLSTGVGGYVQNEATDGGSAGDKVECPVCSQLVSESEINEHLDQCLS